MSPLLIMLLLVTVTAMIEAVFSQPIVNSNDSTALQSGDDLSLFLMQQVYALKPKLAALEAKTKEMELDLAAKEKQIETLQNRKDFRCESGVIGQHANPNPSWPYTQQVTFQTPFEVKPTVSYGLFLLDSAYTKNLRVGTEITDVTKTGFQVRLLTWADTELYGARITWMACGK